MKNFIETILIMFIPQIILIYLGKPYQIMIVCLGCSIITCAFLQDKVNILRLGKNGIELDMKKAINEAYATIDNIKELMDPIINYNLYDLWGHDTNGYNISKEIIEIKTDSNKVHLDKFKHYMKELDVNSRKRAEKLYDELVEFLNETSDIDDSNY